MTNSEIMMAIFTAVIAVTGVIGALIFNGQLTAMRDQLTEMKTASALVKGQLDAAERDQRPWVFLANVQTVGPMNYDPVNKALNLTFQFITKNAGRSPAHGVRVDAILVNQSRNMDVVEEQRKFARESCDRKMDFFAYPLFPGETSNPPIGIQLSINKGQIAEAEGPAERKVILAYLIGCVSYQFSDKTERHQTGFIFEIGSRPGYIAFDSTRTDAGEVISRSEMRFVQYPKGWYAN